EEGAGVAHEDVGRVQVVHEEAASRAGHQGGHGADQYLALEGGGHDHGDAHDGGHGARAAVHVVEQVERVREHHQPGDGEEPVRRITDDAPAEEVDTGAGRPDPGGGHQLD